MTDDRKRIELIRESNKIWTESKLKETARTRPGHFIDVIEFLLAQIDKRDEVLQVLRRYHGGDGTVTRERVCEALGEE